MTATAGTIGTPSTPVEITNFQYEHKNLQKAYKMQESVTNIGVEQTVANVNEQYIKELNREYFVYSNSTIK